MKTTAGTTGLIVPLFIQDKSATDGSGLGSLLFNTAGLVAKYIRDGGTETTITLQTMTVGTWASGGFVAMGSVAGLYQFGIPNAAIATGAKWVVIEIYGAANMDPIILRIELDTINYQASGGKVPATVAAGDLAVGAIDVAQFSATLMQLLSRRLTLSGVTTNPVTADTYKLGGFYNDTVYYSSTTLSTSVYIWFNGTNWIASTTSPGTTGSNYFKTSGSTVNGTWSGMGSASGTISPVAHGNAVLSSFQPDVTTNGTIATALASTVGNSVNIQNQIVIPPAVAVAAQTPSLISLVRGDTLRRVLPLLGSISSRTKLTFTVKKASVLNDGANTDHQALIQITEGTGISILLSSSIGFDSSGGSLTVSNPTTGEVTLVISPEITSQFPIDDFAWDCQVTSATGVTTPIAGVFSVSADVTQSL